MSVLESIINWAEQDLPAWQSDAVRRLLIQYVLTEDDKRELLVMLKKKNGLFDPQIPVVNAQPLKKGDVSGAPQVAEKINMKAMKDLSNVNAIPDGSSLSFGHEGLTVIYGENATGKSGYARVLKRACSARDTKERILPNIYSDKTYSPAKAIFKISLSGKPDKEVKWEDGQKAPEVLTNIAVFDSKCARVIVDENNKITYLPYGSHVFRGLVELLQEFRVKLENEIAQPERLQYDDITCGTDADDFISQLSHATTSTHIEKHTKWTNIDTAKLSKLRKNFIRVQQEDPNKIAKSLRSQKTRITQLAELIAKVDSVLSEEKESNLEKVIKKLNTAEKTLVVISQESLDKEPLPCVGGNVWQMLYEAAKQYSTKEAYPDKEFPNMEKGSRCVLCMQLLLEEGKSRLGRFREFMEQSTKKNVDCAKASLKELLFELEKLDFRGFEPYKDLLEEIRARNEEVAIKFEEYLPAMKRRAQDMIKNGRNKKIDPIKTSKPSSLEDIRKISEDLELEAQEVEKTAEPEEFEKLKSEIDNIQGRKLLKIRKQKIVNYVNNLKIAKRYDDCIQETKHTGITSKGREIISGALTPDLINTLEEELEMLCAQHLKISLKVTGGYGETSHKMELKDTQLLQGIKLTDILSEGEQHVVGIAGFLAEMKCSGNEGTIVLDDPVCSLDHRYREKVAERIVREAETRQVIIFTHDIAFLLELNSKAGELENIKLVTQTIRYDDAPGRCIEGLPWVSMPVKRRLSYLNKELNDIIPLYNNNRREYNNRAGLIYGLLRETWEAAIEEILFRKTVQRHGSEVKTLMLRYVSVTDEDYKNIFLGMKKCSKWMFGHDKAKTIDDNRPAPVELSEDINMLRKFEKDASSRSKIVEQRRKKLLEPETSEMG